MPRPSCGRIRVLLRDLTSLHTRELAHPELDARALSLPINTALEKSIDEEEVN